MGEFRGMGIPAQVAKKILLKPRVKENENEQD
jgi:hypothetical protein